MVLIIKVGTNDILMKSQVKGNFVNKTMWLCLTPWKTQIRNPQGKVNGKKKIETNTKALRLLVLASQKFRKEQRLLRPPKV